MKVKMRLKPLTFALIAFAICAAIVTLLNYVSPETDDNLSIPVQNAPVTTDQ